MSPTSTFDPPAPAAERARAGTPPRSRPFSHRGRPTGALLGAAALVVILAFPASMGASAVLAPIDRTVGAPGASDVALRGGAHSASTSAGSAGWENLTPALLPSSRFGQAVGYDVTDGYLVLFGGLALGSNLGYQNDTWTFANGSWTNISATTGTAPPARAYASLVFDATDATLVLVGGTCADGLSCNDTWGFTGGRWTALAPAPINPLSGDVVAVYDSTDGYVLMTDCASHSTHRYSAGTWTTVTAVTPAGCAPAMSDDPASQGALLDEGFQGGAFNATWLYTAGNWTNVTRSSGLPANGTSAASESIACYDPDLGVVLQLSPGARVGYTDLGLALTYTYNGSWRNISTALAPPWDVYPGFAWDPAVDGAVLVELSYHPGVWVFTGHPAIADLAIEPAPAIAEVGATESFAAQFLGGTPPFSFVWSFGDGATSVGPTPTHVYTAAATYTVSVSVADAAASSANASTSLQVVSGLAVSPAATPDPTEVGLSTRFAAGVSGGVGTPSLTWSFGDGSNGTGVAPEHAFAASGSYTVNLSASDQGGGAAQGSVTLRVAPALSVTIAISPGAPALGQLANFSANATGGVGGYRYSWAFGDGGTGGNLSRISHEYTTDGPFVPIVTVIDGAGGIANDSTTVRVALNLSVFGNWSMGAAPLPVSFASQVHGGLPGYSYRWAFGDGSTSSSASPAHTYVQAGYFEATLTVTDAAGTTGEASWPLYVAAGGEALQIGVVATPAQIASGGTFIATAQAAGGRGGYSLHWSTGSANCAPAGLASERCTVGASGLYPFTVTVTDGAGSQAAASSVVVAGAPPAVGPPSAGWSPLSLPPVAIAVLGASVGAALALAGVGLVRRSGRPTRRGRPGGNPSPPGPDSEPDAPEDPFNDLV